RIIYRQLFEGPHSIYFLLSHLQIDKKTDGPCITVDKVTGKPMPVDASAKGATAHSICLSIQRLSQKSDWADLESQTLALIGHELGHKLGLNEEQAETLQ